MIFMLQRDLLCRRLRELREAHGFSYEQISKAVNKSIRQYKKYENGSCIPNIPVLWILAELYDVPIDYIIGITDKKERH